MKFADKNGQNLSRIYISVQKFFFKFSTAKKSIIKDFIHSYGSGVYTNITDATNCQLHTVVIIGWGVDGSSGANYWLCVNSWGTRWVAKSRYLDSLTNEGKIFVRQVLFIVDLFTNIKLTPMTKCWRPPSSWLFFL